MFTLNLKGSDEINNAEEIMDALVEDCFRYDDLVQMEVEDIRHNIIRSDTEVLECREHRQGVWG